MTNKPTRRRTAAITPTASTSFWGTLSSYASELAPVAGPLLDAIGQTASAIDRAEQRSWCLEGALEKGEWSHE